MFRTVFFVSVVLCAAHAETPTITFYQHVAPIIYRNCVACHRNGGAGPFPLETFEDVARHASQIAAVTKNRFMPPWLPESGYGHFAEERRLSGAEIQMIQNWVKNGAPAGSAAQAPPRPIFDSGWQLGKPDLVLNVVHPFNLPADGREVFWNFVIPVPLTEGHWVRAIEIHPGNPRAIHHASIILDRARSARKSEAAPGAGFGGMDLALAEITFDPDSNFLAWKPGNVAMPEPEGMAWRADPGMDLVLNVHLKPTGKNEIVAPSIALYFTDKPRTKFAMLIELEHDGSIDIPAGDQDYVVSDDFRCPLDLKVLAVYPHAHYLADLMEAYATLPGGPRKWLIKIPHWDLNWQGVYHLTEPLSLPRGTVISMRYHYDNSTRNVRNPNTPPRRVRGGSRADAEMANLWLQVLPDAEGDQRAILQEAAMRRLFEKYPEDFAANFNLGDLLLTKGDAVAALPYFERASKVQPKSPLAASEFGVALASASKMTEAKQQFVRALELDPKFTDARYDLASAQAATGEWQAAAEGFRQVLKDRPDDPKARERLAEVLFTWGNQLADSGSHEEAVNRYREALEFRANDSELHTNLGIELARLGRMTDAKNELRAALKSDPQFEPAQRALKAIESK
jgi:Flp pilus assembly protein TadD